MGAQNVIRAMQTFVITKQHSTNLMNIDSCEKAHMQNTSLEYVQKCIRYLFFVIVLVLHNIRHRTLRAFGCGRVFCGVAAIWKAWQDVRQGSTECITSKLEFGSGLGGVTR